MAFTPVSGNDGRIRYGSNSNLDGMNAWEMVKKTVAILVYHFEGTQDADSNLYPSAVLRGTAVANVTFSGHMNTDATLATDSGTPAIRNGTTATMDFILVRGTPFGFNNVPVFIEQITIGTAIGTEAAKFAGSGVVVGGPGNTTTVS
jgi:hypothetical protein